VNAQRGALVAALSVGSISISPGMAAAQNSATIQAVATVATGPIQVTPLRDLQFGQVLPGTPSTVVPTAPAAGQYVALGNALSQASVTFTLPANLSAGPLSMPISFGSTSARVGWFNNPNFFVQTFDPNLGTAFRFSPAAFGSSMYVWIGGQVSPAVNQVAGFYSGTVVLTLAYTGS
jgi:hypothetical protein